MSGEIEAVRLHKCGYNCAQSVLCACREYTGLEDKTALAISAGFGGGLRCGEVCGAISGAVMAVGMVYPFNDSTDLDAKAKIALLTKKICMEMREIYGCVRCEELKANGADCDALITDAAIIAERIILDK